jgi:hypothetical protein
MYYTHHRDIAALLHRSADNLKYSGKKKAKQETSAQPSVGKRVSMKAGQVW